MIQKSAVLQWLEQNKMVFIEIANSIWENPEIALKEKHASRIQAEYLAGRDFEIQWNTGGLETAFTASWGKGNPVIGFIGEYDALKNLSQKRLPVKEPIQAGGLGHGCGHNLLGTGGMAAAAAVKEWLQSSGSGGTVRYYGCPAEEVLIGKVYMGRAGAFNDLDAAFNFHPSTKNCPSLEGSYAMNNLRFHFYGEPAHAGSSPHLGRSALDAVELMNVGVNYLREHVDTTTRMHYVISNGGDLPNIVPAEAEVWYFLRAPGRKQVERVTERVRRIAQGAAMMTETRLEEIFTTGCYNLLNNRYLAELQYKVMQEIGPVVFTEQEKEFARQINQGYPEEVRRANFEKLQLPEEYYDEALLGENYPPEKEGQQGGGSTDVADVSWITPLNELHTACYPSQATGHSWGVVAGSGSSIGHKGMLHAAKIMTLAAIELYRDPSHLVNIRKEFDQATKDQPYISPLPENARLPEG